MRMRTLIGNLGQWTAMVVVTFGICIELRYKANLGFVLITVGSLIFAVATKVKYYMEQ